MPVQRRSQRLSRRAHLTDIGSPLSPRGRRFIPPSVLDGSVNLSTPTNDRGELTLQLVKTEPSTPESPTLLTQGYRRRLRRERSARFGHAVLQYDRVKRTLEPWYW